MVAIIKSKHRVRLAKEFLKNFEDDVTDVNHYVFIAKTDSWDDDTYPPFPINNVASDYEVWDEIIALKKIQPSYASHVIPRVNWDSTGETVYTEYNSIDGQLHQHPTEQDVVNAAGNYIPSGLYVLTDEYHVFKCLNNSGRSKSVNKPTLPTSGNIITTEDGYRWMYMYSIDSDNAIKFLTDRWMPVFKNTSETYPTPLIGAIQSFCVPNRGQGYNFYQIQQILPSQSGLNSNQIKLQNEGGVTNVEDANFAFVGCTIWITASTDAGSAAVGQYREIISYDYNSQIATLESDFAGVQQNDTYDLVPTVEIKGNGTGLVAKVVIDTTNKNVKEISIIESGQNYTSISATIKGGIASENENVAQVVPHLPPVGGHGSDPVEELGGYFVMLNARLRTDFEDFPLINEYRKLGLIRNLESQVGVLATDDTVSSVQKVKIDNLSDNYQIGGENVEFEIDEVLLFQSGSATAKAKLIEFKKDEVGNVGHISFFQDSETEYDNIQALDFNNIEIKSQLTSTKLISTVGNPLVFVDREVVKNSGEVLWIEHRRPITRSPDQTEDIKLILEF